ncbi:CRISPR-associated ring nuclease Csm6 [Psychromonas sp. SA13A]|uniref:CRISPR-associated ring nuclease Csm6 n=1 Tax=Psychromonas sp. SA13A TaxID=2686346 RepID=UPI00140B0D14|nr:CRISPR-associated ring nuclease Csm6 [Psychromonas sp. SA13A]
MTVKTTLMTVLGSSPQVVTETLFALKDKNFPSRIIVFTTLHGANEIKRLKVHEKITELCEHYALPIPTLLTTDIQIVKDLQGNELNDIRNKHDQESMADQITQTVRTLVKDDDTAIHASIAGGRKSMSFYMGYIFSIFARPCDTLSHVLVAPEFESANFWFPTKTPSPFVASKNWNTGEEISLDAKDAIVELAKIPFLRLNNSLKNDGGMLTQEATYRDILKAYQLSFTPNENVLEFTRDYRVLLNGTELNLPIETIAFYRIIARTCKDEPIYSRQDITDFKMDDPLFLELSKISGTNLNGDKPFDRFDDIKEELEDNAGYKVNKKCFDSIEKKGLSNTIVSRMLLDISGELKKIAVGKSITFCEISIVKKEMSEEGFRTRTKNGHLGLQLNPDQIIFSE